MLSPVQIAFGVTFWLNFPFKPKFNQTATFQPDGYVNLRGLTPIAGTSSDMLSIYAAFK